MARECSICTHPDRLEIDTALVDRSASYRRIAPRYGLSERSIRRHVTEGHISELLAHAADAERVANADSLLDRVEALQRRLERFLDRVEDTDNYGAILGAFRELRGYHELIGELRHELDRSPTFNLELNPRWLEVRTVIFGALEDHPEARLAAATALAAIESGEDANGHG